MADANQLKIQARREEAAGEYVRASELYREAISAMQSGDTLPDPSLLVRVADLEYRLDDRESALRYYKRAVEDYAEQGLITNAIAVCNKILRVYPECVDCHRRLADLHMDVGLVAEARQNLIRYVEAADEDHSPQEILHALQSFLDRTPDQEVALKLASRLEERGRTEEAMHVLRTVWEERHRADADVESLERKAREIDPDADPHSWASDDALETGVGELLADSPAEAETSFAPDRETLYGDGEPEAGETAGEEPESGTPEDEAGAPPEGGGDDREPAEPEPDPVQAALEQIERWSTEDSEDSRDSESASDAGPGVDEPVEEESTPEPSPAAEDSAAGAGEPEDPEEEKSWAEEVVQEEPAAGPGASGPDGDLPDAGMPTESPGPAETRDDEEFGPPERRPAARWRQLRRMRTKDRPAGDPTADVPHREQNFPDPPPNPEIMAERLELVAAYRDRFSEVGSRRAPNGDSDSGATPGDAAEPGSETERDRARAETSRAATAGGDDDTWEDEAMRHEDWGTTETADPDEESWQSEELQDADFPEPSAGGGPSGGDEALGEEAELRRGLELVDELLEVQPDNLELRERRLRYARRLGDREVLVETCLDLAELLAKEDKRRGARILYRRVLELDPENQAAESGLARLDVGELEEKRQSGKRAGATDRAPAANTPEEKEARRELGRRLWTEFENSIREMPWLHAATQAYQSAGPESLPPLEAFEMLAHYLMARDRHRDAADVLVRALELSDAQDEELADILYYLGVSHQTMGERERATEYFDRLSQVDPEFARVRDELPDATDG